MNHVEVDISGLQRKLKEAQKVNDKMVPALVDWGANKLYAEVKRYVSGPYNPTGVGPGTGGVPIPRVSKRLFNSIKIEKKSKTEKWVISKGSIAPHNVFVHEGTRRMMARRFIADPVEIMRQPILKHIEDEIKKELQKL
jgi:hypothetical protein